MINDYERREVARKLLVLACTQDEIGITERAVIRDLGISSGIYDDCCKSEDVLAVASLIDRPTCRMSDIGDDTEEVYRCSACGEEYFMSDVKPYPWRFCPNCGAVVVEKGEDDVPEL